MTSVFRRPLPSLTAALAQASSGRTFLDRATSVYPQGQKPELGRLQSLSLRLSLRDPEERHGVKPDGAEPHFDKPQSLRSPGHLRDAFARLVPYRAKALAIALFAPMVLMGCDPHSNGKVQDRIELATSEPVMSFQFRPGGSALVARDRDRLQRLLRQTGLGPQDRILLSLPSGATAAQTRAREAHLRGLLAPSGAQIEVIGDHPGSRRTRVEDQGMVRFVQAHRMTIRCPDNAGLPSGCTQSRNLAVMLAEPNDLRYPRQLQPGSARPALAKTAAPDAEGRLSRGRGTGLN